MNTEKEKKKEHKCNPENADRNGRAHYICPECGKDISLLVFYYEVAKRDISKGKTRKKSGGTQCPSAWTEETPDRP